MDSIVYVRRGASNAGCCFFHFNALSDKQVTTMIMEHRLLALNGLFMCLQIPSPSLLSTSLPSMPDQLLSLESRKLMNDTKFSSLSPLLKKNIINLAKIASYQGHDL